MLLPDAARFLCLVEVAFVYAGFYLDKALQLPLDDGEVFVERSQPFDLCIEKPPGFIPCHSDLLHKVKLLSC